MSLHRCRAPYAHSVARALLAILLGSLPSCSRLPVAPSLRPDASGSRGVRPAGVAAIAPSNEAPALLRMQPGKSRPDSIASRWHSEVLDGVPELNLFLLRTPSDLTTDAFVRGLGTEPGVDFAEPDGKVENAEAAQSTVGFSEALRSWADVADQNAISRLHVAQAQMWGMGDGVIVAILDTGIDFEHPALAGAIDVPGIEPGVTDAPGTDRPEGVDTNHDGIVDGSLGHGTHVAGIVHAVAPHAKLLPVRVLDSDGVGDMFSIARGMVLATNRGARIVNLSLGMPTLSMSIAVAVDYVRGRGGVVLAAAGNSDSDALDFPASYSTTVAVAGTDASDHKAGFSCYGNEVDVCAPAVGILSTYWDGGYATWSGTSMATPFVSGIAALLYGTMDDVSPSSAGEVESLLRGGAMSLRDSDPTFAAELGAGRVDAAASMLLLLQSQPANPTEPEIMRSARH